MKIDFSKMANKKDIVCLLGILLIIFVFVLIVWLAIKQSSFLSGYVCATLV